MAIHNKMKPGLDLELQNCASSQQVVALVPTKAHIFSEPSFAHHLVGYLDKDLPATLVPL